MHPATPGIMRTACSSALPGKDRRGLSAGLPSDTRGFGNIMSDDEIRAVIAFIKNTWPEQERQYQAEMTRRERETQ